MPLKANESQFEATTIERLKRLGYHYQHGDTIQRHYIPLCSSMCRGATFPVTTPTCRPRLSGKRRRSSVRPKA